MNTQLLLHIHTFFRLLGVQTNLFSTAWDSVHGDSTDLVLSPERAGFTKVELWDKEDIPHFVSDEDVLRIFRAVDDESSQAITALSRWHNSQKPLQAVFVGLFTWSAFDIGLVLAISLSIIAKIVMGAGLGAFAGLGTIMCFEYVCAHMETFRFYSTAINGAQNG